LKLRLSPIVSVQIEEVPDPGERNAPLPPPLGLRFHVALAAREMDFQK
jgi:hypothetical protein